MQLLGKCQGSAAAVSGVFCHFSPCKFISKLDREARKLFYLTGEFSERRFCAKKKNVSSTSDLILLCFSFFFLVLFLVFLLLNAEEYRKAPENGRTNQICSYSKREQIHLFCCALISCAARGGVRFTLNQCQLFSSSSGGLIWPRLEK